MIACLRPRIRIRVLTKLSVFLPSTMQALSLVRAIWGLSFLNPSQNFLHQSLVPSVGEIPVPPQG